MRYCFAILAIILGIGIGSTASAERIGRNSLVQYQYKVDVGECNLTLDNGLRVEFDTVLANEPENVVAHDLIVLGVPTKNEFRYATVVSVSRYDEVFLAKVVRQDAQRVFLALDSTFLNLFWGTAGSEAFEIGDVDRGAQPQTGSFRTPGDMALARTQLSKGKSCYEDAQAVD